MPKQRKLQTPKNIVIAFDSDGDVLETFKAMKDAKSVFAHDDSIRLVAYTKVAKGGK